MPKTKILIILSALFQLLATGSFSQLHVTAALCENKINPAGVVLKGLHFGWEASSLENGQYQRAYQLVIALSKEKLDAGRYDIYNSAIVQTPKSIMVKYRGNTLMAGTTYYWKVRLWDKKNKVG